jgi:hypothetical protein
MILGNIVGIPIFLISSTNSCLSISNNSAMAGDFYGYPRTPFSLHFTQLSLHDGQLIVENERPDDARHGDWQ